MLFLIQRPVASWRRLVFSCLLLMHLLAPPVISQVATSPAASNNRADEWGKWLLQQIQLHPKVIAARERMNAALSGADALDKPLFNPEFETEFEQEGGVNNYRVGINQSIDLWNQGGARRRQASFDRVSATQLYQLNFQKKLWEALQLLIEYQSATEAAAIAQQQETQIETMIALVEDRQRAGDLGQADAELTYLSLSQQLNDTARAQVRLQKTTALIREILPELASNQTLVPDALWQVSASADPDPWLDAHPVVAAAKANWEALQQVALATRRGTKAVPTVGINGGKEGEENVIALSLSVPLHVRNNFNAEARAASQLALAAEAEYRAIRRKQRALLQGTYAQLQQFQQSYQRWRSIVADRISSSATVLEQQWRAGDLSTVNYLMALQQRAEGLLAGIELRSESRRAAVDWYLQTGQLQSALNGL